MLPYGHYDGIVWRFILFYFFYILCKEPDLGREGGEEKFSECHKISPATPCPPSLFKNSFLKCDCYIFTPRMVSLKRQHQPKQVRGRTSVRNLFLHNLPTILPPRTKTRKNQICSPIAVPSSRLQCRDGNLHSPLPRK